MRYNQIKEKPEGEAMSWEGVARRLFDLLDDIDTADDLAKDNDDLYRNLVRKKHQERFDYGTVDDNGINVEFNVKGDKNEKS